MDIKKEREIESILENAFPKYIKVDGIEYEIYDKISFSDSITIGYVEYDGMKYNWSNQILRKTYEIVDEIPEVVISDMLSFISKAANYVLTIEDLIADYSKQIMSIEFEQLDEIITNEEKFTRELTSLLNKYSKENESNTPDYILANYLISCLHNFNHGVNMREKWYGRDSKDNQNEYVTER